MISSMTGFSRQACDAPWGNLVWEIRAVNHRFLEMSLRLPEGLRQIEMAARETIQKFLSRGKVEATLKFSPGTDIPFEFVVNESLVKQLASVSSTVSKHFPNPSMNEIELLKWPGVLETKQTHMDIVALDAIKLLEKGVKELVVVREREGAKLTTFLQARCEAVKQCVNQIEQQYPSIQSSVRDKILARFKELSIEADNDRVEQEMVFLLQKMDVAEEIQRLNSHVGEVERVITKKGVAGRRLDFLMQELNREANTLGSKSVDSDVTQVVVDLKVNIEQMREQVQNIE